MKNFIKIMLTISGIFLITTFSWTYLNMDQKLSEKAECGVVFGAAVWKNGNPSHALYDRTKTAADLYNNDQISCIILSGADSPYGHEVDVMKKILMEEIPSIAEKKYKKNEITKLSTQENKTKNEDEEYKSLKYDYAGVNTLKTIQNLPNDITSFVMISNDFHLGRIRMMIWKEEIKNVSYQKAQYNFGRYYKGKYFFFREMLGLGWYFIIL